MKQKCYFLAFVLVVVWGFTGGMAVSAPKKPTTVAELALYKGADRQQILEEGAKKEGKLVFYTDWTMHRIISDAFQKKYPYIKVEVWRAESNAVIPRVLEEYKAGRHIVSVLGLAHLFAIVIEEAGILQSFYSPTLAYIEEGTITKAPGGEVFTAGHYETCVGVGYNTKLITKGQIPKTVQDLLDPKWKGKTAIAGSSTGVSWAGCLLENYGEEFVKRVAEQKFDVHMVSGKAIIDMVINGEYAFSPTVFNTHAIQSKNTGAPVDWIPLEPVSAHIGQIMLPQNASNPHAALLYIDFDLSKEAGEIYKANGYPSPRKDVTGGETYYKSTMVRTLQSSTRNG